MSLMPSGKHLLIMSSSLARSVWGKAGSSSSSWGGPSPWACSSGGLTGEFSLDELGDDVCINHKGPKISASEDAGVMPWSQRGKSWPTGWQHWFKLFVTVAFETFARFINVRFCKKPCELHWFGRCWFSMRVRTKQGRIWTWVQAMIPSMLNSGWVMVLLLIEQVIDVCFYKWSTFHTQCK